MNSNMRKMYTEKEIVDLAKKPLTTYLLRGTFEDLSDVLFIILAELVTSLSDTRKYGCYVVVDNQETKYAEIDFNDQSIVIEGFTITLNSCSVELLNTSTGEVIESITY